MPMLLLLLAALVVGTIAIGGYITQQRRQEEMSALAKELGFTFDDTPDNVHTFFEGFEPFEKGSGRRSFNLLQGTIDGIGWQVFDYRYTTGSGDDQRTHRWGIVAATVPMSFPKLTLRPEGIFDRLAAMAGFDDLNFESEEFSRLYHVRCDDRQFAYNLIDPGLMEYLLSMKPRLWQMRGNRVILVKMGYGTPGEIRASIRAIQGMVDRIPTYLKRDHQR